jgi:hypothetical protein
LSSPAVFLRALAGFPGPYNRADTSRTKNKQLTHTWHTTHEHITYPSAKLWTNTFNTGKCCKRPIWILECSLKHHCKVGYTITIQHNLLPPVPRRVRSYNTWSTHHISKCYTAKVITNSHFHHVVKLRPLGDPLRSPRGDAYLFITS